MITLYRKRKEETPTYGNPTIQGQALEGNVPPIFFMHIFSLKS